MRTSTSTAAQMELHASTDCVALYYKCPRSKTLCQADLNSCKTELNILMKDTPTTSPFDNPSIVDTWRCCKAGWHMPFSGCVSTEKWTQDPGYWTSNSRQGGWAWDRWFGRRNLTSRREHQVSPSLNKVDMKEQTQTEQRNRPIWLVERLTSQLSDVLEVLVVCPEPDGMLAPHRSNQWWLHS